MRKSELEGLNKHEGPTPDNIILSGLTGSHAYGLNHNGFTDVWGNKIEPSDIDTRGVFVAPTKEVLSLGKHKQFIEQKATDTKYDEVERFIMLCLNANPERLEMLGWMAGEHSENSPHKIMTKEGQMLVENQDIFLSKKVIATYGGYSTQQRKLLERLENPQRKTKPAIHLIRLTITGARILCDGVIDPDMRNYRTLLMDIRSGVANMEKVFEWHDILKEEFDYWARNTTLPDEPDYEKANEILLEIRRKNLKW